MDPMFDALDAVVPRERIYPRPWLRLRIGDALAGAIHRSDEIFSDWIMMKIKSASPNAPRRNSRESNLKSATSLNCDYPPCDTILLLDVLHYWMPEKQQLILNKARRALRPGGRLILRDAARAENSAHRRVTFWEKVATRLGHNKTVEGLHFQTRAELEAALRQAGFAKFEIKPGAGRDSNVLLVAFI